MKAIAVLPGHPESVRLAELSKPAVDEVPGGRGVLVRVLRVGVDGTDKEIDAAEYGAAPAGYDFLVVGHESLGQVEAVGPAVTELAPGDYVAPTVRRPGSSIYDRIGTYDMTTDDVYCERGINLEFVLGNKVMVGTVNANREHFEMGVRDLAQAEAEYPGWLSRPLTGRVRGLDNYRDLFAKLAAPNGSIKVYCEVAAQ
jgi:hypothetical protein